MSTHTLPRRSSVHAAKLSQPVRRRDAVKNIRLAIAQIRPSLGDLEKNLDLHLEYVRRACDEDADVVMFPEQSLTGYFLSDLVTEVAIPRDDDRLNALREASMNIDIIVGFIEETADHRFIPAAGYLHAGSWQHIHHKIYLVTYGLFDEARDLAAGSTVRAFTTPIGRQAMLICEDLWHPSTASIAAADGADIIYGLSSSPGRGISGGATEMGSSETWHTLNRMYAQLHVCFVAHCNRVGYEDGVNFWGGSEVIGPDGETLARAPDFEEALVVATLDDSMLRRQRARLPLRRDENVGLNGREFARIAAERHRIDVE